MRNAFNKFALVCASLVLSALILEVLVRSFVDMPIPYSATPGVIVREARGFWAMEPGRQFVFDNGIDFRDKPAKIDADGGRQIPCAGGVHGDARRIILIGDSQTFGVGLSDNETWANRLQCRLNAMGGEPAKVHNLGVPGIGVDQYFRRGRKQIVPSVVPGDIVVVSVTWNDLHTFYTGEGWLKTILAISGLREKDTGNAKTAAVEVLPARPEDRLGAADRSLLAMQLKIPVHRLNKPTWRYRVYRDYGVLIPAFGSFWEFGQSMVYTNGH